uniref:Uncharacterized protein n=1 Tax=Ananas comosus var. bracteatus TaxID=296719 RepID=A0A6V7PUZ9_ANACO|nr:unnamed protein product [Ananas comosus var. bracteatus]
MAAAKKPPPHPHPHPRPLRGVILPPILKQWGGGGGETERGLEELREKLMGHLREAADRMELAVSASAPSTAAPEEEPTPPPSSSAARPWNLRARRGSGGVAAAEETRRRSGGWEGSEGRRARFSIELTAEEIEADIYALTESRPRRRPRKRPRIVQRRLDSLFPGLWLSEVSVDLYKVPDE